MKRVRCWDNGGATADRYTVAWIKPYWYKHLPYWTVASMSSDPTHPLGVWGVTDYCTRSPEKEVPEWGKRIPFSKLPEKCQELVRNYWED